MIYIICQQFLHNSSKHGTSSFEKHVLAKAHIAMLNELTESEVTKWTSSNVDETAFAILTRQSSWGSTIVCSQWRIIFNILVNPYWSKWKTKRSKLVAKDFDTSEFHQDTWNQYRMLEFVSAYIWWNTISNLELQQSYKALWSDLVLPSATTHCNICQRESALTVDVIEKQLPSRNKVSQALDGWTFTNKLAMMSVTAYYMYQTWVLREVQLTFEEVVCIFFTVFIIELRMIDQWPTYSSKASHTFKGRARSFEAYWWLFAWYYDW